LQARKDSEVICITEKKHEKILSPRIAMKVLCSVLCWFVFIHLHSLFVHERARI